MRCAGSALAQQLQPGSERGSAPLCCSHNTNAAPSGVGVAQGEPCWGMTRPPGATGHHTPRPHGEAACQLQGATREPLVAKFLPNFSPESLSAARRHPIRTGQALPGGANTMDSPPTAAIMHFTESAKLRFKKLHASNVSEEY